jgi:hypothetical protein
MTLYKDPVPNLTAIEERFDSQAAQALEDLIEHVEHKNPVKVTGLKVNLVPGKTNDPSSPGVEVNLTVERARRRTHPR